MTGKESFRINFYHYNFEILLLVLLSVKLHIVIFLSLNYLLIKISDLQS